MRLRSALRRLFQDWSFILFEGGFVLAAPKISLIFDLTVLRGFVWEYDPVVHSRYCGFGPLELTWGEGGSPKEDI
jgi:hypothetical protein